MPNSCILIICISYLHLFTLVKTNPQLNSCYIMSEIEGAVAGLTCALFPPYTPMFEYGGNSISQLFGKRRAMALTIEPLLTHSVFL